MCLYNKLFDIISYCVEGIAVYKGMIKNVKQHSDNNAYVTMMNNSALISVIRISNLFGSYGEENHWKNIIDKNLHDAFKEKVILSVFSDEVSFVKFHDNLKNFRNNYAVHLSDDVNSYLPFFDEILELLQKTYDFLFTHNLVSGVIYERNAVKNLYFSTYLNVLKLYEK